MAAFASVTKVGGRIPVGQYFQQTLRVVSATGIAQAAEWIAKASIGLSEIVAVIGHSTLGTTDVGCNFVMNAQGTGVAEGTNKGDLGVESTAALTNNLLVTVLGKP
jgi:hypothetical protein